jgi:undecaprenyl-diphosphatase
MTEDKSVVTGTTPGWLRLINRIDFQLLLSFLAILLLVLLFRQIANWIDSGTTDRIDYELLRLCRDDSPELNPRGSPRFVGAVRDFTALGSGTVLSLLVITVSMYYLLQGRWRTGLFLLVTSTLGWGLMEWTKDTYARPRPTIVPHLVVESSYSFPSGHAKMSAVIYLTLGALLAGNSQRRSVRIFWISLAIVLTLIIGCSRVYLGVHHPSDVLAGWFAGAAWAMFAFLLARVFKYQLHQDVDQSKELLSS